MKYGFMVSEPHKYLGTMAVINVGMGLFYAFSTSPTYWYLIVLSALFHFATVALMIVLALIDPGIIPKIFSNFEQPDLRRIPISRDYITG